MVPTPVGSQIIAAARIILAGLDDIKALALSSRANLGGAIRLGVVSSFGPYFLPFLLPQLHADHRELRVYIREDRPRQLEAAVLSGEMDCGLGQNPGRDDSFDFRGICRERIFLGVPINHPIAALPRVSVQALKGERLLTLGPGHRLLDDVRSLAAVSGAILAEDYEGTSLDTLRQMVSIEMGLSLFPELYIRSEMRSENNVALVELDGWVGERQIGVYWRRQSMRGPHFQALAEMGRVIAEVQLNLQPP